MVIWRGINILLVVSCLLFGFASMAVATSGDDFPAELEVTLDFQNVELIDLIGTISELTGKNFVYDESVRGKVSIISPKPVSVADAYRLFSTVLRVKGYTIVPSGKVNKIVSIRQAKEENLPISDGKNLGEQFITRIIELKNLDAKIAVDTILRPLTPKTSYVVAHVATNTVVITDSAANIKRLSQLLTTLDNSWAGERMEIVPLQYSPAEETAALVKQILAGGAAVSVRGVKGGVIAHKTAQGQIIPYERTNKLMLLGDDKFIQEAKELIAQLDEKVDAGRTGVHVYYLEHAESVALSKTLNQIISGAKKNRTGKADAGSPMQTFGEVVVTADKPTNALIVNATVEDYENVQGLIKQLDIKRKQVFVETLILELSMDALLDLGTSLQGVAATGNDGLMFATTNAPSSTGSSPTDSLLSQAVDSVLIGGMFNPITTEIDGVIRSIPALSALIGLSQNDTNVNVLSAPRLLTSDNEEAEIIVGSNVPIITSKTKDNDGNPVNSVERQDVALTLKITPQITEGNLVRLKVYQEISDVAVSNVANVGVANDVGPILNKRVLRSTIVAQDGKTVVLGGLFQTNKQDQVTKVPLLGDIPLLGYLFKRRHEVETKTSLLIFITPRVIRDSDDMEKITRENQQSLDMFKIEGDTEVFFDPQNRTVGDVEAKTPVEE